MLALLLLGCGGSSAPQPIGVAVPGPETNVAQDRSAYNDDAVLLDLPVFWVQDDDNPGVFDPDEAAWLWDGRPAPAHLSPTTLELPPLSPAGNPREEAVRAELGRGRSTLVLTTVAAEEEAFVLAMMDVATAVEALHALQRGVDGAEPAADPPSRALFRRNQGPRCTSTATDCSASVDGPADAYGVYPEALQSTDGFCATLEKAGDLMNPFTAVRRGPDGLIVAVPYPQAWPEGSSHAASALKTAANALPESEGAMAAYLRAAATAFLDNDWVAADEAWLATRSQSRWYVRVGADETYWEPCDRKAGYHLLFARVNAASEGWQARLEPQKAYMEQVLAKKAAPYTARDVAFSLPEFIDVVLNAGDSRSDLGATIGQSLPNWGPVAEAGGRTVAMTNLNIDGDSLRVQRERAESLFCDTHGYTADPEPLLFTTLLHEAAHNLGPASGYRVNGKTDEELFGGSLSSMLEELKAQTAALYLTDVLAERGVVSEDFATKAHLADLVWAMGKISDGMTDPEGGALAYPQLSAIQLGLLRQAGVVQWHAEKTAANGADRGCFSLDLVGLPAAIEGMADQVLAVKGQGDVERAQALKQAYVDEADAELFATIRERWRRAPENAFVYGFRIKEP